MDTTARTERCNSPDCVEMAMARTVPARLEIVLPVLDLSGSMDNDDWPPTRLRGAQDACIALIERKAAQRPQDYVGIVSFAGGTRIEQPPVPVGRNVSALRAAVNRLSTYGCTDMGAGLVKAEMILGERISLRDEIAENGFMAWLLSAPTRTASASSPCSVDSNAARRIVLLSDGADNGNVDPVPVAQRLVSGGVEISCIGIGKDHECVQEDLLRQIASRDEDGRPRYWFIGERMGLIRKFEELATNLRCLDS